MVLILCSAGTRGALEAVAARTRGELRVKSGYDEINAVWCCGHIRTIAHSCRSENRLSVPQVPNPLPLAVSQVAHHTARRHARIGQPKNDDEAEQSCVHLHVEVSTHVSQYPKAMPHRA